MQMDDSDGHVECHQAKESGMLILTRRIGEKLIIDDDIVLTVLAVKGSQVRIGVEAPESIGIYREEIYKRIQSEQDQAASGE